MPSKRVERQGSLLSQSNDRHGLLAESDRWTCVGDMRAAVASIGDKARIVFCGIGRLAISELRAFPEHHYVIRLIDAPEEPIGLPHVTLVQARGPFKTSDDIRLFREHGVEIVLAKNSGGEATISKIEAARTLALPVIMVERPFYSTATDRPNGRCSFGLARSSRGFQGPRRVNPGSFSRARYDPGCVRADDHEGLHIHGG